MKRMIILAIAMVFAASMTVSAQTTKPATSAATSSSVKHDPAKPASSNTMHAYATTNKKTRTAISANELPKAAQDYIARTYPGKKPQQMEKFTEPNGTVKYKAEVDGKYLHFDANGKLLNEPKKEATNGKESKPSSTGQPHPVNK